MPQKLITDTDVLVDVLRGHPLAVAYMKGLPEPPSVSVVTVAELYTGVREGPERDALEKLIATLNIVPVDTAIAVKAGLYRRDLKSHQIQLADALIAATADSLQASLVSLNQKHFPMLPSVLVPYQKS